MFGEECPFIFSPVYLLNLHLSLWKGRWLRWVMVALSHGCSPLSPKHPTSTRRIFGWSFLCDPYSLGQTSVCFQGHGTTGRYNRILVGYGLPSLAQTINYGQLGRWPLSHSEYWVLHSPSPPHRACVSYFHNQVDSKTLICLNSCIFIISKSSFVVHIIVIMYEMLDICLDDRINSLYIFFVLCINIYQVRKKARPSSSPSSSSSISFVWRFYLVLSSLSLSFNLGFSLYCKVSLIALISQHLGRV